MLEIKIVIKAVQGWRDTLLVRRSAQTEGVVNSTSARRTRDERPWRAIRNPRVQGRIVRPVPERRRALPPHPRSGDASTSSRRDRRPGSGPGVSAGRRPTTAPASRSEASAHDHAAIVRSIHNAPNVDPAKDHLRRGSNRTEYQRLRTRPTRRSPSSWLSRLRTKAAIASAATDAALASS